MVNLENDSMNAKELFLFLAAVRRSWQETAAVLLLLLHKSSLLP